MLSRLSRCHRQQRDDFLQWRCFSNAANQQYKIDTNGQSATLASALTSVGGTFTTSSSGTLTITGNSTYSGITTASSGALVVNGSLADTGQVVVKSGASIGGSGTDASTGTFAGLAQNERFMLGDYE